MMARVDSLLVTSETASMLLDEYFDYRALSFSGATDYRRAVLGDQDFREPAGDFLVLFDDDVPVGCGGIRALSSHRFEVKHLWIRPIGRGRGFGRQLLTALEKRAVELGAMEMVLDTNAALTEAGNLYLSFGYTPIEPYNDNPNATDWFGRTVD